MSQTAVVPAPRRTLTAATVVVLALLASLLTSLATAAPASAAPSVGSAERALAANINYYRRAVHRSTLATSPTLTLVARRWAQSMARSNRLAHNPRVTSQVRSWHYLGENVGVGATTWSLHKAFIRSAPHRANVTSSRYTRVGVGVAYGHGRMWVVELFERPSYTVHHSSSIGYGARGTTVKKIQRRLRVTPTGYYGTVTRSRVKAFQRWYDLPITGKVDSTTRRRMGV
jgi:uncharacterized protein YkwD